MRKLTLTTTRTTITTITILVTLVISSVTFAAKPRTNGNGSSRSSSEIANEQRASDTTRVGTDNRSASDRARSRYQTPAPATNDNFSVRAVLTVNDAKVVLSEAISRNSATQEEKDLVNKGLLLEMNDGKAFKFDGTTDAKHDQMLKDIAVKVLGGMSVSEAYTEVLKQNSINLEAYKACAA